jgi:serine/threonine protein kinase
VDLKQVLGKGSFGEVKLCRWKGTQVAVKVLPELLNRTAKEKNIALNEFRTEARTTLVTILWHPCDILVTFL